MFIYSRKYKDHSNSQFIIYLLDNTCIYLLCNTGLVSMLLSLLVSLRSFQYNISQHSYHSLGQVKSYLKNKKLLHAKFTYASHTLKFRNPVLYNCLLLTFKKLCSHTSMFKCMLLIPSLHSGGLSDLNPLYSNGCTHTYY